MKNKFTIRRSLQVAELAMALTLGSCITGCGETSLNDVSPTFPVSGRCLFDGEPAAGVRLVFHKTDSQGAVLKGSPRATATVQPDGNFKVTTFSSGDGAIAGNYVVTAAWPGDAPNSAAPDEEGPDRLEGRYAAISTPAARITVGEQNNQVSPILLRATAGK